MHLGAGSQEFLNSPIQGTGSPMDSPWLLSCSTGLKESMSKHQEALGEKDLRSPFQGVGGQTGSDSLTIYIFLLNECVISQFYTPLLTDFYKKYHDQKVGFIGYFPSFNDKPEAIEAFGKKYKLDFPLKQDYYKVWTKKMGATVTPEVAVWDHRTDRLIYRGRIDDSYVRVGKRKLHPQSPDLKNIIDHWLLNETPDTLVQTQAIGCFISFNGPLDKE